MEDSPPEGEPSSSRWTGRSNRRVERVRVRRARVVGVVRSSRGCGRREQRGPPHAPRRRFRRRGTKHGRDGVQDGSSSPPHGSRPPRRVSRVALGIGVDARAAGPRGNALRGVDPPRRRRGAREGEKNRDVGRDSNRGRRRGVVPRRLPGRVRRGRRGRHPRGTPSRDDSRRASPTRASGRNHDDVFASRRARRVRRVGGRRRALRVAFAGPGRQRGVGDVHVPRRGDRVEARQSPALCDTSTKSEGRRCARWGGCPSRGSGGKTDARETRRFSRNSRRCRCCIEYVRSSSIHPR